MLTYTILTFSLGSKKYYILEIYFINSEVTFVEKYQTLHHFITTLVLYVLKNQIITVECMS